MSSDLPEKVYSPDSAAKRPMAVIVEMGRDVWRGRELAWRFAVRDISAKFRQSWLGYLWAFLPPLVSIGIFLVMKSMASLPVGTTDVPYAVYMVSGVVIWHTFVDALTIPMQVVGASRSLLSKISFPREALLISAILQILFNLAVKLVLLVGVMILYSVPPGATVVALPIALAFIIVLGMLIGVLLVPLGMLYNDFQNVLPILATLWMLITPVGYAPPSDGLLGFIASANPVSPLIVTARELLLGLPLTELNGFLAVSFTALGISLFAWLLYRLAMPIIIERMAA